MAVSAIAVPASLRVNYKIVDLNGVLASFMAVGAPFAVNEDRGVSKKEAKSRAWATVNKESGGGKKNGSGRGKKENRSSSRKGGRKGGRKK